jgi:N-acetylglucosaminyldiphosphoundecaprenol N-acetyl-beta-D-mannosaminyltransferase
MRRVVERELGVYFLGGSGPVVEEAVQRAKSAYPGLRVCGYAAGYFEEQQERAIAAKVRASGADLLILARGSGLQRGFLSRNLRDLGVSVVWNAGGLFNFVSGQVPRAPRLVRALRLEWLFRLLREPGRMWHRNVVIGPWLLGLALRERWSRRASVEVGSWKQSRIEE